MYVLQKALETYVKTGRVMDVPDDVPDEMLKIKQVHLFLLRKMVSFGVVLVP